ncbi:NAD(P)-dependent oxidoreductase [Oceanomicrobium pacificus]|uniref:Glyoxylate/hydroxypyruvate reductase A n=1 Tax=Oceanomicrobium pacificus TaxID=2692916 RepID=A0A6B0U0J3_9RHOB|nr:NAD(P)-dependent oxidoreductase [Oceanomicrobium pacificus]MXU64651.1 glyoxylate/hydroxypyruvate reductase A [Oceanomicrobium pacificus]
MTLTLLFAAGGDAWTDYAPHLDAAIAEEGLDARLVTATDAPGEIDYIIYAPDSGLRDFAPYTRLKAVMSLWAGVESIVDTPSLTVPLCRMVDPGLTEGMVEWVTGHVLRHHLGMDRHILGQDGVWRNEVVPPLARHRPVGLLGLGALGAAVGRALVGLGFPVHGWSRSAKRLDGITCRHGADGLAATLAEAQILVSLLPATAATDGLLDADALALLPKGAVFINPGRGSVVDDAALLAALDAGRMDHATLDVFRTEPLPADHPFWAHPRVTVTPHIASATRPDTAAQSVIANIANHERGAPLAHQVDRSAGY